MILTILFLKYITENFLKFKGFKIADKANKISTNKQIKP